MRTYIIYKDGVLVFASSRYVDLEIASENDSPIIKYRKNIFQKAIDAFYKLSYP